MKTRARGLMLLIAAGALVGCSGHGDYTEEGVSLAKQRLDTLKAATELDMAEQAFLGGDLDKAMRKTDAALALMGDNAAVHVLRGRVQIERGNMGGALVSLERAAELDEESVEARYYLGVVRERLDEREAALAEFKAAAELDPYNPQYTIAAGEMLIDLGRAEEAKAYLLASDSAGHAAGVQQLLGHIAMIDGRPADACDRFGKARLLAPDDGAIIEDLATAQIAAGKYAAAESNLGHLLKGDDNRGRRDLLHMRAECMLEMDRPVESREIYRGLIRGPGSNDTAAWLGLGRASYTLGDDRTLQRAASRAVSINPRHPGGYVLYAVWHRGRGERDEALRRLDTGLMRAGPDAELLATRALVLSELGRRDDAIETARAAVALDPDSFAGVTLLERLTSVTSVPVD